MIGKHHKVFCSYAFTGEDKATVTKRMHLITSTFKSIGVDAYCNLFDTQRESLNSAKDFIDSALKELETADIVFVVMTSERRSEGMLIEIGAAYAAGKPIVLAQHESAKHKTYLDQLAKKTVLWQTDADLKHIIKELVA